MRNVAVVIPSWNAREFIGPCLASLRVQTLKAEVIVVENGSTDGSLEYLQTEYPEVTLVVHKKNQGFAGGVNAGIREAMKRGYKYVALFNNDAVAEKDWLKNLAQVLDSEPKTGIATSKITDITGKYLDSTGDFYTIWGLPFPRGRGEVAGNQYDDDTDVFGASGGASLYRIKLLKQIGLFDEDFFAYFEDVDISFRAQLAGWKVRYVPEAKVRHQIGATSSRLHGFTTYQTLKNLPMLFWKNVPWRLVPAIMPRLLVIHTMIFFRALTRRQFSAALRGFAVSIILGTKKLLFERHRIQAGRKVTLDYVRSVMVYDLPPNVTKLRRFNRLRTGRRVQT